MDYVSDEECGATRDAVSIGDSKVDVGVARAAHGQKEGGYEGVRMRR